MAKVFDAWYTVPSILYIKLGPEGDVTLMLPVGVVQSGCVAIDTGAAGAVGTGWIVTKTGGEMQLPFCR